MKKTVVIISIVTAFCLIGCYHGDKEDGANEITAYQQELQESGWTFEQPEDDDMPEKYGITPVRGILDNYFDIELGEGYDMAVKIVDMESGDVVRYVFVREGTTATITEIPAGKYYLKLAYGHGWMVYHEGDVLIGKFTDDIAYEKSDEIFDFGAKNSIDAVSYSLKINVRHDSRYENFATSEITEEDFFND